MGSAPAEDYYSLLGVEAGVDRTQLRRAWRKLALRWHPDRAGVARAAYDRQRGPRPKRKAPAETPRRRAPPDMLWRLSGSLKALLAQGIARRAEPDLIELTLSRREAAEGGMVTISMRVPVRCLLCRGRKPACERCGGKGAVSQLYNAWLAVPPDVPDGAILTPAASLGGMLRQVRFRLRVPG
jgi:molecular chaperone DnaJ